jgi:hypothetical protein
LKDFFPSTGSDLFSLPYKNMLGKKNELIKSCSVPFRKKQRESLKREERKELSNTL